MFAIPRTTRSKVGDSRHGQVLNLVYGNVVLLGDSFVGFFLPVQFILGQNVS